ncbi:MAG: sigma 54-dependent transcriptional regulator, partial [Planctomycetes bacterium]|nr:sigma 54-dependent transcriptional regulator [Planctomycetota bacterium]
MSKPRRTVVLSLYGTSLDRSIREDGSWVPDRWDRWRPTLSICQQPDFLPDRLEVLAPPKFSRHCEALLKDVNSASPETETRQHSVAFRDPWDFSDVYADLRDFADSYPFDQDNEQYFVHMTTGTHVAQICLFLLVETRHIPARLIQTSPPATQRRRSGGEIGTYTIIDLDLSRYDQLAARFEAERQTSTSFLKDGI